MMISVRTFLKFVAGFAVAFAGGLASAQQPPPERLSLSGLIGRIRTDPALRARFAEDPRGVMSQYGIDAAAYNLPARVSQEQMDRLLDDLARSAARQPLPPLDPNRPREPPSAPVYGPPPGMRP